mmetsp:Transcript_16716/g.35321  ORF Transcript_16716/g.35321 Transcript_16716/m.35321 type:complete len:97 (-) Transcript_16716:1985-2275(-)
MIWYPKMSPAVNEHVLMPCKDRTSLPSIIHFLLNYPHHVRYVEPIQSYPFFLIGQVSNIKLQVNPILRNVLDILSMQLIIKFEEKLSFDTRGDIVR